MSSTNDKDILQDIIDLRGDCLSSTRCAQCPFRSVCLPGFLSSTPPTHAQRFRIALDTLSSLMLLDDDDSVKEVQDRWNKK